LKEKSILYVASSKFKIRKHLVILLLFIFLQLVIPTCASSLMQSYPPRALDRRLQEDWAREAGEDPRILMSLRVDFGHMS